MTLRFHTALVPFGPASAVELTDDQVAQLGGGKRAAVVVTIAGRSERLRLGVMGGRNVIGLSKAARSRLGVGRDDEVDVEIHLDEVTREVDVPTALAAALDAAPGARAAFDALSYTRRKEIARGVVEAKRDETRERRIAAAVEELSAG